MSAGMPAFTADDKQVSVHRSPPVDWVEAFFGLTRRSIQQIQLVNSLVAQRSELLRTGNDNGEPGRRLRLTAAALAKELGGDDYADAPGSHLDRTDIAMGKAGRIRRGTSVSGGIEDYDRNAHLGIGHASCPTADRALRTVGSRP